jgi:hypothetical protein
MLSFRSLSNRSIRNMTLTQHRQLSTRSANVLKAVGISTDTSTPIPGIFDGKWKVGSGEVLTSKCPATGETLAQIKSASRHSFVWTLLTPLSRHRWRKQRRPSKPRSRLQRYGVTYRHLREVKSSVRSARRSTQRRRLSASS